MIEFPVKFACIKKTEESDYLLAQDNGRKFLPLVKKIIPQILGLFPI